MLGGGLGNFAPGEWTDDTSMALPLLQALADGADLLDLAVQDEVVMRWVQWRWDAKDVGNTVAHVLSHFDEVRPAHSVREQAARMFESGLLAAGNGSLMRTTPLVIGYLHDPQGLVAAARTYSDLTHGDPDAADACALWNLAQRHAVLEGELDLSVGIEYLPAERADLWRSRIDAVRWGADAWGRNTGWVVGALQAAWWAITNTAAVGPEHFEQALRQVISLGGDTDTVAAIAGGLLGARWGISAIPLSWRRVLHGWPGLRGQDLVRLCDEALTGRPWPDHFYDGYPVGQPPVPHPNDPGVWMGDVFGLQALPDEVDTVMSLCRLGVKDGPAIERVRPEDHIHVWLIDSSAETENPHLDHVASQAVELLAELREQGKEVFLHCVQGKSRTAYIAALYGSRVSGLPTEQVLQGIREVLPQADPNGRFMQRLQALE